MKRFLLYAAIVLAVFGSISHADAKDPEDQEFRHVVVTLKSGEKVEGYLHRGWHAEGALQMCIRDRLCPKPSKTLFRTANTDSGGWTMWIW